MHCAAPVIHWFKCNDTATLRKDAKRMAPVNGTLVLQDLEGNLYALTPALLEQARVPDEQRAALQERLQAADVAEFALAPTDEVAGYGLFSFMDGSVRFIGGIVDGTSNTLIFGETTSRGGQGQGTIFGHGNP
jgi:hypothetical protein